MSRNERQNFSQYIPKITVPRLLWLVSSCWFLLRDQALTLMTTEIQHNVFDQGFQDGLPIGIEKASEYAIDQFDQVRNKYPYYQACEDSFRILEKKYISHAHGLRYLFSLPEGNEFQQRMQEVIIPAIIAKEKEAKAICFRDPSPHLSIRFLSEQHLVQPDFQKLSNLAQSSPLYFDVWVLVDVLMKLGFWWGIASKGQSLLKMKVKEIKVIGFEEQPAGNPKLAELVTKVTQKNLADHLIPAEFKCFITKSLMTKPVRFASDDRFNCYNLDALHAALNEKRVYPGTNIQVPMDLIILTRDRGLEMRMIEELGQLLEYEGKESKNLTADIQVITDIKIPQKPKDRLSNCLSGMASGLTLVLIVGFFFMDKELSLGRMKEDSKNLQDDYLDGFKRGLPYGILAVNNIAGESSLQLIQEHHRPCKNRLIEWEEKLAEAVNFYNSTNYWLKRFCAVEPVEREYLQGTCLQWKVLEHEQANQEAEAFARALVTEERQVKTVCLSKLPSLTLSNVLLNISITPDRSNISTDSMMMSLFFQLPLNMMAIAVIFIYKVLMFVIEDGKGGKDLTVYGFENERQGNLILKQLIEEAEKKELDPPRDLQCQISFAWPKMPVVIAGDRANLIHDLVEVKNWLLKLSIYPGSVSTTRTGALRLIKLLQKF